MEVLHDLTDLRSLRGPVYLAIGIFDGVHRGHQALIGEAQADARKTGGTAVVMTFEPHPMMFFQRGEPPLRLSSPRHKEILLARQGVTHLAVLPFEAARAGQTAEAFVEDLRAACQPLGGVVVGADWKFGKGRAGDVGLLKRMGGFEVDGIPAVTLDGEVISSTAIRVALANGNLDFAEKALGRPYAVFGQVVPGRKIGRKLGFPTANVELPGWQLPPDGVYAVGVRLGAKASLKCTFSSSRETFMAWKSRSNSGALSVRRKNLPRSKNCGTRSRVISRPPERIDRRFPSYQLSSPNTSGGTVALTGERWSFFGFLVTMSCAPKKSGGIGHTALHESGEACRRGEVRNTRRRLPSSRRRRRRGR
jgi:riboflavin kinase/FMN adenylyltransferase